ncbi:heat shock protein beta-1-like [Paramacrobiotus metropolitanus]|uniref:heat shock protein beta-1-like n=1 Tax=Paramacrobiotus metropolitanus TaxID=2943436 RepID=UPI002445CCC8|nr:heat shock protein beta-1-like [Paramacrobiotus metropolitanus]
MALLPLYHRDLNWDVSPWSERDSHRWQDFTIAGFNDRFSQHVGHILTGMDASIMRMDEEMRRMMQSMGAGRDVRGLLRELEDSVKPAIVERNGTPIAQYSFDVKGFRPEEITIKTVDNTLEIEARHDEARDGGQISHAYKRTITIPAGIQAEELQGKLVDNGVLRVEAPYRAAALTDGSRMIPIMHEF